MPDYLSMYRVLYENVNEAIYILENDFPEKCTNRTARTAIINAKAVLQQALEACDEIHFIDYGK